MRLVSKLSFVVFVLFSGGIRAGDHAVSAAGRQSDASCLETRCGIDIGSGSTKVQVARVDRCKGRILDVLFPSKKSDKDSLPVLYKQIAESHRDNLLDDAILAEGVAALNRFTKKAKSLGADRCRAVATAVFREERTPEIKRNRHEFIRALSERTGVPIQIIPQEVEARMGLKGALAKAPLPASARKKVVVWDIGGASMQMISTTGETFFSPVASEEFRRIIQKLEDKDAEASTPNPISEPIMDQALDVARKQTEVMPTALKRRLRDPDTVLLGIGGVHNSSIKKLLRLHDGARFDSGTLERAIRSRLEKDDAALGGGPYANVTVSNLILVKGFLDAVGAKVLPVQVNMTDGVLVDEKLWK